MNPAGEYVRLVTKGRRSGTAHSVIVKYVAYEGGLAIFPEVGGRQDWVANLKSDSSVEVFSGSSRWEGRAEARTVGSLTDPVLGAFTRKYGEAEVRRRYWGQRDYFLIRLLSQSPEDYVELVYSDLEVAFDGVAEDYDHHIMDNPMNLWLRNRSVDLLSRIFRPGDLIVEVGCGTGTETLQLAKRGVRVIATDISSGMLGVMMRKAEAQGMADRVVPVHCRPYQIQDKVRELGFQQVDGAYSTYGAVNTEPRLPSMMSCLHSVIRKRGRLVLGVWNKYCLYELVGYSFRAKPRLVVARLRNPVPVGRSRFCVATNAFTVESLGRAMGRGFTLESVRGVGILLPPSNLTNYLPREGVLELFKRLDVTLQAHYPWSRLGDHFLAVYVRDG